MTSLGFIAVALAFIKVEIMKSSEHLVIILITVVKLLVFAFTGFEINNVKLNAT